MRLILADYLMIIAFILMLAIHGITQFLITQATTDLETAEAVNALITYVEANPLGAYVLKFEKLKFIYSFIFVPSIFISFYYYIRTKYWYDETFITMIAILFLSGFIINFNNDFAVLLGYLARS